MAVDMLLSLREDGREVLTMVMDIGQYHYHSDHVREKYENS